MGIIKGSLITFEGIEGSGKSTQINKIYHKLKKNKIKCIKTREPGGTFLSEKIRKLIINGLKNNEDSLTELLLIFASRSNHFKKIYGYLKKGYVVLCDRYIDSTYVYQHYEQNFSLKFINLIQRKIDNKILPKITFFIDIPSDVAKKRLSKRKKRDRFDKYNSFKLNKLRNSFLKLTKKYNRIIKVNGTKSMNEIHNEIKTQLIKKNVIKNIR
ncbi:MAG: dTMP kinase [Pelagibacteraceae bacterium]